MQHTSVWVLVGSNLLCQLAPSWYTCCECHIKLWRLVGKSLLCPFLLRTSKLTTDNVHDKQAACPSTVVFKTHLRGPHAGSYP